MALLLVLFRSGLGGQAWRSSRWRPSDLGDRDGETRAPVDEVGGVVRVLGSGPELPPVIPALRSR